MPTRYGFDTLEERQKRKEDFVAKAQAIEPTILRILADYAGSLGIRRYKVTRPDDSPDKWLLVNIAEGDAPIVEVNLAQSDASDTYFLLLFPERDVSKRDIQHLRRALTKETDLDVA